MNRSRKKRLLIDANSTIVRKGQSYIPGVGRTTLDLIRALAQIDDLPFEIVLYSQTVRGRRLQYYKLPFKSINFPLPGNSRMRKVTGTLPIRELFIGYDLLHIPHNFDYVYAPEKTVVTIHDAMFFSYPEDFLGHASARERYPELARKCKAIVTCSRSSKNDIVHYMNIPPEKVTVIPWGVNTDTFYPQNGDDSSRYLRDTFGINRPYFFSVSCDVGRKNTISLARAYKKFLEERANHDLVLVWKSPPDEYIKECSREIGNKRIHILKSVTDDELRMLYSNATAMFFPSKYEGFGLPVLESMACGTPVVTCRNSSLHEAGGDAALYTGPDDIDHMVAIMEQFDSGNYDIMKLRSISLEHAKKYSWEKTARAYTRFYEENLFS